MNWFILSQIYSRIISMAKDVFDPRDTAVLYAQRANCYLSVEIFTGKIFLSYLGIAYLLVSRGPE